MQRRGVDLKATKTHSCLLLAHLHSPLVPLYHLITTSCHPLTPPHFPLLCLLIPFNAFSLSFSAFPLPFGVISRLDYANSALYGVTDYLLNKLQLAQNNAARLVRKKKKYDHITPVLKDLHCLPVKSRIIFKLLSIIHSAMYSDDACPSYLQELVSCLYL